MTPSTARRTERAIISDLPHVLVASTFSSHSADSEQLLLQAEVYAVGRSLAKELKRGVRLSGHKTALSTHHVGSRIHISLTLQFAWLSPLPLRLLVGLSRHIASTKARPWSNLKLVLLEEFLEQISQVSTVHRSSDPWYRSL